MALSEDGFITQRMGLLASSGYKARETAEHLLLCTSQPPQPRNFQLKVSVVLRMRKAALVELTSRGLTVGGGRSGGRVKGDTKLFWFLSVGIRKTREGHCSYNLSWVQMKRFCGHVCGVQCPGRNI